MAETSALLKPLESIPGEINYCRPGYLREKNVMKKLTKMDKAIRVVDISMNILAGPGSAQEEAWGIVKKAAQGSEPTEICRCDEGRKWALLHEIIPAEKLNYCPSCGGKLSPVA